MDRNTNLVDLNFDKIQLLKLVSAAEILLSRLYDFVDVDNQKFIDQWFCYKQEFDQVSSQTQYDVNENIPELRTLPRIDEVSENEKITSPSSSSSVESFKSSEMSDSNKSFDDSENLNSSKYEDECNSDNVDCEKVKIDLVDHMNEFELLTDGTVNDWFKNFTFNAKEIREYVNCLKNEDNKDKCSIHQKNKELDFHLENDRNVLNNNVADEFHQNSCEPELNMNQYYNTNLPERVNRIFYWRRQIQELYSLREMLLRIRENINFKFKEDRGFNSMEYKTSLKVDITFEIIDAAIEMKNSLILGQNMKNFNSLNDEVDTIIADCLHTLSLPEIRSLFLMYMKNIVEVRKSGAENDKQFSKLLNEISSRKFLIWQLYKTLDRNKQAYNYQVTLRKKFEHKLQLISRTTKDGNYLESVTAFQAQKFLSVVKNGTLMDSGSEMTEHEIGTSDAMAILPHISENLKTKSSPKKKSDTTVTRGRKKIIIQTHQKD